MDGLRSRSSSRAGGLRRQFPTLCALLLSALPAFALDPDKRITQYARDVWQSDDGLPQDSIYAIAQTPDGYLWLGTDEGLVRFDGARFTVFDKRNTPELLSQRVFTLMVDREGALWIGTHGGGLSRLKDGAFATYTAREGLPDDSVWALHEDRGGRLWVGTRRGGLARFEEGRFAAYPLDPAATGSVLALADARDGGLWVGTDGGGLALLGPTRRHTTARPRASPT